LKRTLVNILITLLLISCSAKKSFVIDYNSERLCNGIKNMTKYIENSNEVKIYFSENNASSTELKYEVDTLVTEGISFPFLQSEVANFIKNEEKIPLGQANKKLEMKFLAKPSIKLNSGCLKKLNINKPKVKIEYYYYPEYGLLTAEISKIKYIPEYGKGFLILAKIDLNGEIKILKTSFWEE
jgi:hypothetical protein